MASAVSAVATRAWRPSAADTIEDDLAQLWRDIARDEPISRALMSNLVVLCRGRGDADSVPHALAKLGVEDVVQRHPARVIVLVHDFDAAPADPQAPWLEARVDVLTFGAPEQRYGVEQVVIRSACGDAAMRSIVRHLILGDLPTSIWWTEDLSTTGPLAPLAAMGRQFLYDSGCWSDVKTAVRSLVPLLEAPVTPDLADVNWRRLAPVRHAILSALGSRAASRDRVGGMRIRYRRGEEALAWLLAGWVRREGLTVPTEDPTLTADLLIASLADGLVLRLLDERVIVEDPHGPAPFVLPFPREQQAEAIAHELRVLTRDTPLHGVLHALARHFART
jgi:hypothetical protein